MFNTYKNSKDIFNLLTNAIYNIIMGYINNINRHILQKKQVITHSTKKRMMSIKYTKGGEYLEESNQTQAEFNKIEQESGELFYLFNGAKQKLEINNSEFLNIIDKDFKKNKNNSLINSIGRYVLKNDSNTKPEPSSYHLNLKVFNFSLDSFILPFLFPLLIDTSFKFDNINIFLDIGEEYIYDDEDKETPIDMQIYQSFTVIYSSIIKSYAGIYLPFGIGNMHIEFVKNGILCRSVTNTNIAINILNNTYSIKMKGNYSHDYHYFLRIGMTINLLFFELYEYNIYLFNLIMVGSQEFDYYVSNSFREPFLESNEEIFYSSYSN
jgi:hypothetical protein